MARDFKTPIGRMVQGNLYEPKTESNYGGKKTFSNGPKAGQARPEFYFAIAIAKGPESHWNQTEWGQIIWAEGQAVNANRYPKFAWKIIDGDSQVPNDKGKKWCDHEGFAKHWVIKFSSAIAPVIYNAVAPNPITLMPERDVIKCGYYIQVIGNVRAVERDKNPGVFLNYEKVALIAYGPPIVFVDPVDPSTLGFGGALPAGASLTPVTQAQGFVTQQAPVAAAAPAVTSPVAAPAQVQVPPHYGILTPPVVPVPAAAPSAPQYVMTAKANGNTREQLKANGTGWTDALLLQQGMMVQV